MECKIENCNFKAQDIAIHILRVHKITIEQYKEQYKTEIVDEQLKRQRIESRKKITCQICSKKFSNQKVLQQHLFDTKDKEHSNLIYNEGNSDEWIECKICGLKMTTIKKHILIHNLNSQEYREKYGELHSKHYLEDLEDYRLKKINNFQFLCQICEQKFSTEQALNNHILKVTDKEHSCLIYNEKNLDEWVECKICGLRRMVIETHIRLAHNLSVVEYKEKFKCEVYSKNYLGKQLKTFSLKGLEVRREKSAQTNNIENSHMLYNEKNKNDWVECKICGYRAKKISIHVISHELTLEQYKEKYGKVISETYLEQIKQNGRKAAETVSFRKPVKRPEIQKHKCELCENIIEDKNLICVSCKLKNARIKKEEEFTGKQENIDFVRCQCLLEDGTKCNWPDTRLTIHILQHGYSGEQYRQQFTTYPMTCKILTNKTAFRGKHSEETKNNMSKSHLGQISWNTGKTKETEDGLKRIAEKAKIRLSQLSNNPWHINPPAKCAKNIWSKGLTAETSELVEQRNENAKGLFHHQSSFNNRFILNDFVNRFELGQKQNVRTYDNKCMQCDAIEKISAHHIIPKRCFDYYDLSAHDSNNLISLCEKCHSRFGQAVDKAIINCNMNIETMMQNFKNENQVYQQWMNYTSARKLSILPIAKSTIQMLPEQFREELAIMIMRELKLLGFPYLQFSQEELLKDFENVKTILPKFENEILRNFVSSGTKLRDHFIHQQYANFLEFFNDDKHLLKLIRNRLGLGWNGEPEFFDMTYKTILRGFEVVYPSYRFSKYQSPAAKWIIDTFCTGEKIYDYAAGWGARMIAAAATNKKYIGVDTNSNLIDELKVLANWLQQNSSTRIFIEKADAANFDSGEVDFAYSCPPYSTQEKYNGVTFKNDNEWLENYMKPVIANCYKSLKPRGRFVCHISCKLIEKIKQQLNAFQEIKIIQVANARMHCNSKKDEGDRINEVILVYEKP